MGLLNKLQSNGSTLSTNNGGSTTTIPGGPFGNHLITPNSGHGNSTPGASTQALPYLQNAPN